MPCPSSEVLVRRGHTGCPGLTCPQVATQEGVGSLESQFPVFPSTTWLLLSTSCRLFECQYSHLRNKKLALNHLYHPLQWAPRSPQHLRTTSGTFKTCHENTSLQTIYIRISGVEQVSVFLWSSGNSYVLPRLEISKLYWTSFDS